VTQVSRSSTTPLTAKPDHPTTTVEAGSPKVVRFQEGSKTTFSGALNKILGAGKHTSQLQALKWRDNLSNPSLLGIMPSHILTLPGAEHAWATMLVGRAPATFKRHSTWQDRWITYCEQNHVSVTRPLPLELASFVGMISSMHGPNQAIQALGVVRTHLSEPSAYYKQASWYMACLSDGLEALAAARKKPRVAIRWNLLQAILVFYITSKDLADWEVRNVCFMYVLFISGGRPEEVVKVLWRDLHVIDANLEEVCQVSPFNLDSLNRLTIPAYRLQMEIWIKTNTLSKEKVVIPCGSEPCAWIARWGKLVHKVQRSITTNTWLFPNMSGSVESYVSYGAIGSWWNGVRDKAHQAGVCSKEIRDIGTLYTLKYGFISELHEADTPLSVAMMCTRHTTVQAHMGYVRTTTEESMKAVSQVMSRK